MSRKPAQKLLFIAIITLLASLLLTSLAFAAQNEMRTIQAPQDQPHTVEFATSDLPPGVSITIIGTRTNPGGREPLPFSVTFDSPGPGGNVNAEPGTAFNFSYPTLVSSGGVDYTLVSVLPISPFTTGPAGETTTVVATYEGCQPVTITTEPTSQTVTYGSPVTFSVVARGTAPLSYQWYKDLGSIGGATLSDYSITSVSMADAGSYHVVVSNACGVPDTSTPATLTVDKATPTCSVTGYSVTYDGSSHTATGSCTGVHGETLNGLDLSGTTHTDAGPYTDSWTFTDVTGNYNNASGSVSDNIDKANPSCLVAGYTVTYDGNPHTSTGSCTGVLSETLSGLDLSGTTHTNAGTFLADPWSFTDVTGNYNNDSGTVNNSILKADQTITFAQPSSPVPFMATFDINPTATSGLTVSVVATGACTLSGSTVTMVVPFGSCTLTASQGGNSNYNAALDVVRVVDLPASHGLYLPLVDRNP